MTRLANLASSPRSNRPSSSKSYSSKRSLSRTRSCFKHRSSSSNRSLPAPDVVGTTWPSSSRTPRCTGHSPAFSSQSPKTSRVPRSKSRVSRPTRIASRVQSGGVKPTRSGLNLGAGGAVAALVSSFVSVSDESNSSTTSSSTKSSSYEISSTMSDLGGEAGLGGETDLGEGESSPFALSTRSEKSGSAAGFAAASMGSLPNSPRVLAAFSASLLRWWPSETRTIFTSRNPRSSSLYVTVPLPSVSTSLNPARRCLSSPGVTSGWSSFII